MLPNIFSCFSSKRNIEIVEETKCMNCIHIKVCNREYDKRCINYSMGSSMGKGCEQCHHHYNMGKIPCFLCKDFSKNLEKSFEVECQ